MRRLKQIIKLADEIEGYMEVPPQPMEIMALDEQGELWFGTLETSSDKRKVVNWSPVQLPPDGMSFSKPQLSFWDRMEKEAHDRYQASLDPAGETETVEKEEQTDTGGTREEARGASDQRVKDGEGIDPGH